MDTTRVDRIIQYALAASDGGLCTTQLVKLVYLADTAHAEAHGGETYTGAPWRFLHYGPWAGEVQDRVEPAARGVGAKSELLPKPGAEDEYVRFHLRDERLAEKLRDALPGEIAARVRWSLADYRDTPSLLRHVYLTWPFLRASPGETLDFSNPPPQAPKIATAPEPVRSTVRQRRARRSVLEERRTEFERRLRASAVARDQDLKPASPLPRYDDVFHEGMAWLDSLAGPTAPESEIDTVVDDSVWRSDFRRARHE